MEALTRSQEAWQSTTVKINQIKNHINRLGQLVADLHNERAEAKPWQQDAIDRITPLLKEMASNTTWCPEYRDLVRSNAELATDLSKLVSDYIDYGNARSKARELGQKLGISVS